MSNQNQTQTQTANNNNAQNQSQKQVQAQVAQPQPQVDMADIVARQQMLIEGLAADRDALVKNSNEMASLIKQMKDELLEVKAELREEKLRAQLQQEAEQKAMALVATFKTSLEAGGLPATVNGNNNSGGGYDRRHYLFKFGDKRRRGIF